MVESEAKPCPSEQECRALVQRILFSKEFRRATRLREFLLYVVDRKLAGSPQELTEVFIGHRVFGRPAAYNPGEDSIVRTEARNLRQRLERYFAGEGGQEPILLEIPKGAYLPVFRRRAAPPEPAMAPAWRGRWLWRVLTACLLLAALAAWRLAMGPSGPSDTASVAPPAGPMGLVELDSSDSGLVTSFRGAKQRALEYVYTGDAVGDWYDSTAGKRYAFCMRDVSHQSVGAAVLGLHRHTRNMLRRFAASIAESRDWCGFWEINKDGFPAPVDYRDDKDFWYCLPANFDLVQACYRQFLWTGDQSYFDAVFSNFYDRTVTSYVAAWDRDRDGLMESPAGRGFRGIPSYYQGEPRPFIGGDLLAAQYKGYLAYAAIQERRGGQGSLSQKLAEEYRAKAQALRVRYNTEWWNPVQNRYYSAMLPDRAYYSGYIAETNVFALLFGLTEEGLKTEAALDCLQRNRPKFDQAFSYFPEILFQYGRSEPAYRFLLEITDPNFRGRGMPEICFAAVGAVGTGLMGISADAPRQTLETLPRLPKEVEWVKLAHVPVLNNQVAVHHRGVTETVITNQAGPLFYWKASFPAASAGRAPQVVVDGAPRQATSELRINNQAVVFVVVPVRPGQTRTAKRLPLAR